MPTTPKYDVFQQVFCLNALANAVWMTTGTQAQLQAELATQIKETLASSEATVGNWSVVWGPQVWQDSASVVADNGMYVAYNPAVTFPDGTINQTYVVALAATCPLSIYDWCVEDFTVNSVVDFDSLKALQFPPTAATAPFSPTTPLISMGTAVGVSRLLQMTSPTDAPAAGQSLITFLNSIKSSPNTVVIFTGHSLAGALSPALALWLKKNGYLTNFGLGQHFFYATAGATPGNLAFATECAANFIPTIDPVDNSYKVWNRQLWNTLDVVPHAWSLTQLAEVPTLYGNSKFLAIDVAVAGSVSDATSASVAYVHVADQPLTGTLHGSTPTTTMEFLAQALYQHVAAYNTLIAETLTLPSASTDQAETTITALAAKLEAKATAKQPAPAGA